MSHYYYVNFISAYILFSCKTRGFCPSCHAKRREEWGEGMILSLLRISGWLEVFFICMIMDAAA